MVEKPECFETLVAYKRVAYKKKSVFIFRRDGSFFFLSMYCHKHHNIKDMTSMRLKVIQNYVDEYMNKTYVKCITGDVYVI